MCGLLAAGALAGCSRQAEKDLAEIRQKQDEILAKLGAIEEAQKKVAPARQGPAPEDYSKVYALPIADSPVRGDPDGPVTIVEFSDFQCPFCARAAPLIADVLKKYPKGVRFVYKQFPLPMHPMARPAAQASLAAQEQGKFWEMHDVLIAEPADARRRRSSPTTPSRRGSTSRASSATSSRRRPSTTSGSTPRCRSGRARTCAARRPSTSAARRSARARSTA